MKALVSFILTHQKGLTRIMAIAFFLAPIVNITLSFLGSGVPQWYQFSTMSSFLKSVPALDYFCLLGFLLAGALLLLNKPFSLHIASLILGLVSFFGVIRFFDISTSSITEFYLITYTVSGSLLNILFLATLIFLAKNKKFS
jgi:hypothetical protein